MSGTRPPVFALLSQLRPRSARQLEPFQIGRRGGTHAVNKVCALPFLARVGAVGTEYGLFNRRPRGAAPSRRRRGGGCRRQPRTRPVAHGRPARCEEAGRPAGRGGSTRHAKEARLNLHVPILSNFCTTLCMWASLSLAGVLVCMIGVSVEYLSYTVTVYMRARSRGCAAPRVRRKHARVRVSTEQGHLW